MSLREMKKLRFSALRFKRQQDGSITFFALVIFMLILMITGTAVDMVRHEHQRVNVQQNIDMAVLAAASVTQNMDKKTVMEDYLRKAGIDPDTVNLEASNSGEQYAQATARVHTDTILMTLLGIEELNSPIGARASEQFTSVEISLVLDFTSSMYGNRIAALRGAVDDFINVVFQLDCSGGVCYSPLDPSLITVNVVPYGGTVNPGAEMAEMMGLGRWHSYASCGVMPSAAYNNSEMPYGIAQQLPHFYIWHRSTPRGGDQEFGWCPQETNAILYGETDPQVIKDYVDGLSLNDGTGTNIGMKWGMALLDPSSRDEMDKLVTSGTITGNTTGNFPANDSADVLKVVVLMTDGGITSQMKPRDFEFEWLYDADTGALLGEEDVLFADEREQVFTDYASVDENGEIRPRSTIEGTVPQSDRNYSKNNPYIDRDDGIDQLTAQCDLAATKNTFGEERVTVYSVRLLESAQWTEDYMKPCATTDGHYFDVTEISDLSGAFVSIAAHIRNKLLSLTN